MKKTLLFSGLIVLLLFVGSCSGHKDCQGHRHHVKTEMGGYL